MHEEERTKVKKKGRRNKELKKIEKKIKGGLQGFKVWELYGLLRVFTPLLVPYANKGLPSC